MEGGLAVTPQTGAERNKAFRRGAVSRQVRDTLVLLAVAVVISALLQGLLGGFNIASILVGYGIAWVVLRVMREKVFDPSWIWRTAVFLWDFHIALAISNYILAKDIILFHRDFHRVRMIKVPVGDLTDAQITLLSHRITLTPGTLSCMITEDRSILLVHAMYDTHMADEEHARELRRPVDKLLLKGEWAP